MTITICDICGKQTEKSTEPLPVYKFAISSHGRVWDICDDCRGSLNRWMTIRKEESEYKVCRGCHFNDGEAHAECVMCEQGRKRG